MPKAVYTYRRRVDTYIMDATGGTQQQQVRTTTTDAAKGGAQRKQERNKDKTMKGS
jgi:hypothetical protein